MCFCVLNEHCLSLSLGHRFLGSHEGSRLHVEEVNESNGESPKVTFEARASLCYHCERLCVATVRCFTAYAMLFITGLLQVRASEKAVSLSLCLHQPVPRCVPENIMRFSSVAPPGVSTLCFLNSIFPPQQLRYQ